jgi:hypothetical protein
MAEEEIMNDQEKFSFSSGLRCLPVPGRRPAHVGLRVQDAPSSQKPAAVWPAHYDFDCLLVSMEFDGIVCLVCSTCCLSAYKSLHHCWLREPQLPGQSPVWTLLPLFTWPAPLALVYWTSNMSFATRFHETVHEDL